jgi:uncharacterized LabA/DUF88 family protein
MEESVVNRFTEIVIASGDAAFADKAAVIAGQGVVVTVLSKVRSLSKRLQMASSQHIHLHSHLVSTKEVA